MTDTLETISGFHPIIDKNSVILILGTIPGNKTLELYKLTGNEDYYINFSHNKFWGTTADILKLNLKLIFEKSDIGYQYRKQSLLDNNIALWDIYSSCERAVNNASDNKIKNPVPNDIRALLSNYPKIRYVFTNGLGTYKKFIKINKHIESDFPNITFSGLTSTSSANNGNFNKQEWEQALFMNILK